jgi:hypothetical protein
MAKRGTTLGGYEKSKRSPKTKKRLAAKVVMLAEKKAARVTKKTK